MSNADLAQRLRKYMSEGWESLPQLRRDVMAAADAIDQEHRTTPGQAEIADGHIVIRVEIAALPAVVEGAWASGGTDTRYKVTNAQEFAADLLRELNREEEDGTTRIHQMFDAAMMAAINNGAFGIEEHEDQDA